MSKHLHIMAKEGAIAETVLLPGDPLRAKFIAENFLENAVCYNEVRGMYGYTGTYKGKRVSIQGTGMGLPSHSIYVNELIQFYGAKRLIRIGSAGSCSDDVNVRDIVLAQSASTNSGINKRRFNGLDYAPTANFDLLYNAYNIAKAKGANVKVGNVLSSDLFYDDTKKVMIFFFYRAPPIETPSRTLPLQLTQPRHPHGTQGILLSAASFLT